MTNQQAPSESQKMVIEKLISAVEYYSKRCQALEDSIQDLQAPSATEVEQQLKDFREMNDSFEPSATVDEIVERICDFVNDNYAYIAIANERGGKMPLKLFLSQLLSQKRYTREEVIKFLKDYLDVNDEALMNVTWFEEMMHSALDRFDSEGNK